MRDTSTRCIDALFQSCADGDAAVRESIIKSLCAMATKDLVGVLRRGEQWLSTRKPSTTTPAHRYVVVKAILAVMQEHAAAVGGPDISTELRESLVACAFSEMTSNSNDLTSDWAKESCAWMVELCGQYPKPAMQALHNAITSSALPHYYVVQAIADAAQAHPLRMLPYVKESLAKLLPILSLAKQDNHRMVMAQALGAVADAVVQCAETSDARSAAVAASSSSTATEPLTPRSAAGGQCSRAEYADAMNSAIQFLLGDWSRSSELRVRIPVVFAMGSMVAVCSDASRVTLIPKVLPLVVAGVKREKNKDVALPARGLVAFLSFVSDDVSLALSSHMDTTILPLLFQTLSSVLADKEFATSTDVRKAHAAILQCMERAIGFYPDAFLNFLNKMLDNSSKTVTKEPALRAAVIQVLRHITSRPALEPRLKPYKDHLIATIKLAQGDADWRVRTAIASCVVAMGNSSIAFFDSVGGHDLLTFVVKSAAVTDSSSGAEELRDAARNTLALFATGGKLDGFLWPFLLEHFHEHTTQPSLLTALPTVARCLVQIASRVSQTDYYYVDFGVSVNVPKPHQLAAKWMVQAMQVEVYSLEELHTILEAMVAIAPLLDDPFAQNGEAVDTAIANVWLSVIPELQRVLMSGDERQLCVPEWEELCCKLVTKTITCRQSEQWVEDVTAATVAQLAGYQQQPLMFRSALVVIGIGIGRSSKKDFVSSTVEHLINTSNHDQPHHRAGLSRAFGYIAALHPDLACEKLGLLAKGPEKIGFFQTRDKSKKELSEYSRAIAAHGLCHAARRMQAGILPSRLDAVILPTLTAILSECKLLDVREAVMDGCVLLEAPLRKQQQSTSSPSTSSSLVFQFKGRDGLLDALLKAVPLDGAPKDAASSAKEGNKGPKQLFSLTCRTLQAITALISAVSLPMVSAGHRDRVVQFTLQAITRSWSDATIDAAGEQLLRTAASGVLQAVLNHPPTLDLDALMPALLPHTVHHRDTERERAVVLCVDLFHACADRAELLLGGGASDATVLSAQRVTPGPLLGRMVPRCMDAVGATRVLAVEGIQALCRLTHALLPEMFVTYAIDTDAVLQALDGLKSRCRALVRDKTQSSEKEVTALTKGLCVQLVTVLPDPAHVTSLLETLLAAGITDPQDDAASCSCVVLHGVIRGLGATLAEPDAKRLLEHLIDAVDKVKSREQSLAGILVSIRNMVKHHTAMGFRVLLQHEPPHTEAVVQAVQAVAGDATLATALVENCLDLVLNSQLVEERIDPKDTKEKKRLIKDLAPIPFAAVCVLGWTAQVPKGAAALLGHRADCYGALLLYLTAAHEHGDGSKTSLVSKALQLVISNTAAEITVDRLERFGWARWNDPVGYPSASMELVKYLCREDLGDTNEMDRGLSVDAKRGLPLLAAEPTAIAIELAQFMLPYCNKPIKSHRRTGIHVCRMLLRYSLGEKKLLQSLGTALLSRSGSDEDAVLRAEALEAFPSLAEHDYSQAQPYVSPMLTALVANFTDTNVSVSVVALRTAMDFMSALPDKEQIAPIAVNIILKAKALFETKDKTQRRLAFDVYCAILRLAIDGVVDGATMEQHVYLHLTTLLAHCLEEDDEVRTSVRTALTETARWISAANARRNSEGASSLRELFEKPNAQPTARVALFDDFADQLCFVWVAHFAGRVNDLMVSAMGFFSADRDVLRLSAVTVCGYLLKHLPPSEMGRAHVDQLCNALVSLLNPGKEKAAAVRSKAARALGLLRDL